MDRRSVSVSYKIDGECYSNYFVKMKIFTILFFSLIISILVGCSFFQKGDCRKSNSCPITFFQEERYKSNSYVLDEKQTLVPYERAIRGGTKLILITDSTGKPQTLKGFWNEDLVKCLLEEKEIYINPKQLSYGKKIRTNLKPSIVLIEEPKLNSKTVGTLNYNSTVMVVSELEPSKIREGYIRVTSNDISGWAQRKNFTDGDYNAEYYGKPLEAILQNFSIRFDQRIDIKEVDNETLWSDYELEWKGGTTEDTSVCIRNHIESEDGHCGIELKIDDDSVMFSISPEYEITFECKVEKSKLLESTESAKNGTLTPHFECKKNKL
ncbi:hypothetical protein LIDJA_16205 [Leptospira interrogans]|uniref:Uncharacterized protein n=4 Tax=Leptospira interrogans TaxID=173 RepID=A0A0F6HBG8_LEPIR|nr:conserved hypothetical protein [Leptospira interrogans serovar Copenhageni str. Fiocruz L1-130]EKO25634.1 hypothetical protein LEP1GSC104_4713 [Leptospira interrogans str. UI 12621]KPA24684.1 Uncharacterized protein AMR48_3244 [Leptospira interrogans]OBZ98227.1 Uncharacterized protein A9P81_3712 [Leptospira interrogans serovar Copenhageni/Icterohaemorrhagiae]OCC30266.1 Uncharacterized protein GNX_1195 [Leptospira interrogans serovar Canicola]QIP65664.1 hypothetical protein LICSK_17140 [Lept